MFVAALELAHCFWYCGASCVNFHTKYGCTLSLPQVRRGPYLVQDTLVQINRAKENDSLKKPLKVSMDGMSHVSHGRVDVMRLSDPGYFFGPGMGMFMVWVG